MSTYNIEPALRGRALPRERAALVRTASEPMGYRTRHERVRRRRRARLVGILLLTLAASGCAGDAPFTSPPTDAHSAAFQAPADERWAFDVDDVVGVPSDAWFDPGDTPEQRQQTIDAFRENSRDFLRNLRSDGLLSTLFSPVCNEIDASGNETSRDSTLGQRLTVGNGVTATCATWANETIAQTHQLSTGEELCIVGKRDSVRGLDGLGLEVQVIEGPSPNRPYLHVESASGASIEVRQLVQGGFCAFPIRAEAHYRVVDVRLADPDTGCGGLAPPDESPVPKQMCVIEGAGDAEPAGDGQ